ncbi:hypothetical protein KO491_04955 [Roseovarius nubinhibens]|uniref:hypothetical protein n=1 Tax=Roseovarius nubinhibens TaxID=314263 RepID=UPI001C098003|nr:hypothetical protein [Roseovarius nubinhibens]MBU2999175.1 hypothetical protein [Roseovarius nubinhibens]
MSHQRSGSHDGEDLKTKARDTASAVKEDVTKAAQSAARTVQDEAAHYADRSKETAAREVRGVASALRTAADELRDGSPQERTFSQLADGLADVSDTIRDKDLGEVVSGLNSFARRNPLLFLGGAALAGFAATRFARATARDPQDGTQYGTQHSSGTPDRATSFGANLGQGTATAGGTGSISETASQTGGPRS